MRSFRDITDIPEEARGTSAAMGNFDGVHLGHQAVIDIARRHGAPLSVVTFEPHPREVFAPDAPPFRLMNREARAHRLDKLGVTHLFEIPFDRTLTRLSPEEFAGDILRDALGLSHVVTGADFRFGRDRAGDAGTLRALGERFGFDVTIARLRKSDGVEVSSTRIRDALSEGDPRLAAQLLGHLHRIEGPVLHGDRRGRDLGYPTANMGLDGLHLPKLGVYAVTVDVAAGPHEGTYPGVASLGVRPMFGENLPNLETHLFDFAGDLYGTHLSVGLVEYLRGEEKFDSLDALIRQMDIDSAQAREILS
ncbi:bifunctional riboflavin kinase/FAD synthetase [Palleronia sp. LCG004]|uniref:bifunctional riboflavin kinase/FAD synthetase n=1 Tax=Palleronia sp. LCG004 TaxID=3079304 RepID=UPI0029431E8E|nr:bifunctional riboflavin kinase/FAD synthetase [Palleronia sp. LCG004]WOI56452.1 bifunctional riboflavin kinase/FAD synthetase [Palleronia sp. LCG004]